MLSSIILPGRLPAAQTEVSAAPPGVKADRGVYPPPRAPVLPKAGGVFTDPTFGTEIMRVTDEIVLRKTVDHDEVQVDKSGRFCLVKTGRHGKGVVEVRVVDLRTGRVEDLTDDGPDFAPGHSDNGHGLVVGHDNVGNRVTFRRLDSPHDVRTLLDLENDWSQDYHVSMLGDDESWATLSFHAGNSLPSSGIFRNEIVQVATDGSRRVRRLAHHRSVFKSYWDSPRANISRDGRFIVFTSNWEGTGQRDVFILKVPRMRDFG
jgi:hypothetical protein